MMTRKMTTHVLGLGLLILGAGTVAVAAGETPITDPLRVERSRPAAFPKAPSHSMRVSATPAPTSSSCLEWRTARSTSSWTAMKNVSGAFTGYSSRDTCPITSTPTTTPGRRAGPRYYQESLRDLDLTLADLSDGGKAEGDWERISTELRERALAGISVSMK